MSAVLQTQTRAVPAAAEAAIAMVWPDAASLRARFSDARRSGQRARDAAESLGVSEGQAMGAHAGVHAFALKTTPLKGPWVEVLQALALGDDIDLRLFFGRWHAGFAVLEPASDIRNPPRQSLQFFDRHGVAVHKVFVRAETDREAFDDIVQQYRDDGQTPAFTPAPAKALPAPDAELDAEGLAQAWQAMTDTHQFFGLISRFGAERQQALRLVQGRFTERADPVIARRLLDEAAMEGVSIMVFVSSSGCIQIHSGPVSRIEPLVTATARWLNVLDAGFNLHLREDLIENAWIVQKPTADGVVTSVEIFDARGELMAMFFGSRKPGVPEQQAWRDIAARLPRLPT